MNIFLSLILTSFCAVLLFLYGPIVLIPMTWWIVYGHAVKDNGRVYSPKFLPGVLLVANMIISISCGYLISFFFSDKEFIQLMQNVSSYSNWKISPEKLMFSEEIPIAYLKKFSISYLIYLISLILFIPLMFFILTRIHSFRENMKIQLTKKKEITMGGFVGGIAIVLAIVIAINLIVYKFPWYLPSSGIRRGLSLQLLGSASFILIGVCELIVWFFIRRFQREI